jgi:FkbM family methyltransferase
VNFISSIQFKQFVRNASAFVFGREPTIHKIPFGPARGWMIFMSIDVSPRMYFGIDEPWLAKLSTQYIQPGDVVYDIGAHIGYTSLLFVQQVGKTGCVHAFEILPSVATKYLKRTIDANRLENIIIHNVGLAEKELEIDLSVGETHMANLYSVKTGDKTELCKVVSLDQYIEKQGIPLPSMLKIDIEGAEISCLLGGIELIKRCLPLMIIEFHRLDLLRVGYALLHPLGYKLVTEEGSAVDGQMLEGLTHFHESIFCFPMKSNSSVADSS